MYNGKFAKQSGNVCRGRKRTGAVVLSFLLLLTFTIGGTLAYLVTTSEEIENTFTPSYVDNEIKEDFKDKDTEKNNVKVKNTGDIPAYIRATVIAYWQNTETNLPYGGQVPVETEDYTMIWTKDGWKKGEDGYYYYLSPVAAGEETGVLFTACKPIAEKVPEGYTLVVEVLAQSIQADGVDASGKKPVELAWGIDPATLKEASGT